MKQGYSKPLKFVSMLLLLAMMMTSQPFVIIAEEAIEEVSESAQKNAIEEEPLTVEAPTETVVEENTLILEEPEVTVETALELSVDEAAGISELETQDVATVSDDESVLRYEHDEDAPVDVAILPPVLASMGDKENVNMSAGGINYTESLLSVGSNDGLGYQLNLNYSSNESQLEEIKFQKYISDKLYYLYCDEIYTLDGVVVDIIPIWEEYEVYSEAYAQKKEYLAYEKEMSDGTVCNYINVEIYRDCWYSYYDNTRPVTAKEERFGLSGGWYFSIPYISTEDKTIYLPEVGTYSYYKDADANFIISCEGQPKITLDKNTEYEVEIDGTTIKSWYGVETVDGTTYYFKSNGVILAKKDRYGNTTTYTSSSLSGGEYITSIADTFDRTTTITYADSDTERIITVTAPDETVTTLYADIITAEYGTGTETNYIMKRIVFPDGEETVFTHDIEAAKFNRYGEVDEWAWNQDFSYALLTDIEYSTGASTHYDYESADLTFSGKGHKDGFRLSKRYTVSGEDGEVSDVCNYAYEGSCTNTNPDDEKKEEYTYSATSKSYSGGVVVNKKYTFNNDRLCVLEETYHNGTLKIKVENTYNSNHFPDVVTTSIFGKKTIVTKEDYDYNGVGLLSGYTPSKGEEYIQTETSSGGSIIGSIGGSINNSVNKYKVSYSYDNTKYYLPTETTYYIDADTKVVIANTLINGRKSIGTATISVNGTPVAKTTYTYDSHGRVKSEKAYTNLALDTYIVKEYNYYRDVTDAANYGNLKSVTVKDAVGSDGENADITTSYTYDEMGRPLTVTDANGNVTATEYDSRGRTVKVINPDQSYTEYIYDLVNNITTVDHSLLEAAVCDYDALGRIETTRYADGTIVSESFYDENGRLVASATNRGSGAANTTYYTYDVFDRITEKAVYGADNVPVYRETCEYDDAYTTSLSLVTKTVHGDENAADIITKTYINKHGETVKEDIGGVVTEYAYDYVSNPVRIFYGDTTLATYTYDHAGNVTSETNALEDTRTVSYDAIGRKISESDYKGNITNYTYDAAGRLLTMTAPFADGVNTTVKYYYDANGNVTKQQTAQADNSTEVVWRTVEYKYDCMNRVTDITNYVSDTSKQYTHYEYDAAGNLTHVYTGMTQEWSAVLNPDTYRLVTYTYDSRGNNTAVTDALGQSESYTYDVLGMLTETELRDGTDYSYTYNPLGLVADSVKIDGEVVSSSATEYTATGAVRSVTLDGATVSYTYDGLGNILTETEGNVVKTYTYDSRGRKSGYTLTRNGVEKSTATYTYDALDRLATVTEGGLTTTYTYDKNGNRESQTTDGVTATYTYNNANLVTAMTNTVDTVAEPISRFVYTYYLDGNIRTKEETMGGVTSNTAYVYDGVGRLVSETKDGIAITYEYDAYNNRTKMTNGGVVTAYTYDANNRLLTETTGGATVEYTYDENGNLLYAECEHAFVDGVCDACGDPETYMLGDLNGDGEITLLDIIRIQKLMQAEQPATYGLESEQTFDTADLDQNGVVDVEDYLLFLEAVLGYSSAMPLSMTDTEQYDAFADVNGNGALDTEDYAIALAAYNEPNDMIARLAADVNGDGVITTTDVILAQDHMLNNCVCAVGSMVNNPLPCSSEKSYTYNARGQQIGYTDRENSASYAYNPSGLRSAKTVGGSTKYFVYNGSQIVFEYDDSGETLYYYGLNRTHNSNGEIYVYNAHGDTVQLVNDGVVTVTYTYDAFGNLTSQVGDSDNPFKYCSEYFDSETQTYYLRARYYNPANGRFTQQDAWAFMDTSDPLSLNLYTYCSNNPILYVDPSGNNYVGLRDLVDKVGGEIDWDPNTSTATVHIGGKEYTYSNYFAGINISQKKKLEVIKEGNVVSYIASDSKMYVDEKKFYESVGIIAYDYVTNNSKGTVFIVKPEAKNVIPANLVGENDFLVIDYRRREEGNPAMEVKACYKSKSKEQRLRVIDILLLFENKDPTDWRRSRDSLEWEWWYHATLSGVPGFIGERGRDAMLDNDGGN